MSHVGSYKCSLTGKVQPDLFMQAMAIVAVSCEGKVGYN
ncbi:hypothetical protein LCGC14_2323600, partial [marine sediment metagenome]